MSSTKLSRPLVGVAVLACALGTLTACGSSSADDDSSATNGNGVSYSGACDHVKSGATSDGVKVSGAFGKTPKVSFKKPLKATSLERTITKVGTGAKTTKGQTVNARVTVYLGSGKSLASAEPLQVAVGGSSIPKAFTAGVACLPVGSRSVVTDTAKDVYGASGNADHNIKASDTLVIVTDVISVKEKLVPTKWTKDRARVTFAKSGRPTVTLPKTKAPKKLELQVLKKGTGATVKNGDQVTVDYQGISWNTGKVFDQSYGRSAATFGTDQVIEGFGAALVGQKVGTKLIVSVPPQYAYGKKKTRSQKLSGQTLVFVIDIEKIASSS